MCWLWIFLNREPEQTHFGRRKKHITHAGSTIKGYLDNCSNVGNLFPINNLILVDVNTHEFWLNLVCQNTRKNDQSNYSKILLFKEACYNKEKCIILKIGVEASRKIELLWMYFNYNVYTKHVFIKLFNFITMFLDYILRII